MEGQHALLQDDDWRTVERPWKASSVKAPTPKKQGAALFSEYFDIMEYFDIVACNVRSDDQASQEARPVVEARYVAPVAQLSARRKQYFAASSPAEMTVIGKEPSPRDVIVPPRIRPSIHTSPSEGSLASTVSRSSSGTSSPSFRSVEEWMHIGVDRAPDSPHLRRLVL